MASEFRESVVLITGGGDGIGKATAKAFLERGATVVVFDLDVSKALPECEVYTGSVTDGAAIAATVNAIVLKHGRIDILVNNAGISFYGSVEDGSLQDWYRVLDVNLMSVVRMSRACLPHIRGSSHGAIVNIGSALAQTGMAKRAIYSATKGGVEALTRAMAADLVSEGIRVNCVNPGTVDTNFVTGLAEAVGRDKSEFAARQATGSMVAPEEVAAAVVYLAQPGARSLTASTLKVDAGFGIIVK